MLAVSVQEHDIAHGGRARRCGQARGEYAAPAVRSQVDVPWADLSAILVEAGRGNAKFMRLARGPEADFTEDLGMYVATAKVGISLDRDHVVIIHDEPGTAGRCIQEPDHR